MEEQPKDLLRFVTAGSVDDGKSTLIGRLLFDTKTIFEDQLESLESSSKKKGEEFVNLALVTDGLRAEREQGITIDVAYRYFATPKRKFILADAPGHVQYTRNMVTGASNVNLAVIMIDARHGVIEQTKRHSFICSLLGINHLVVCINKMDLVGFDESVYEKIKADYLEFSSRIHVPELHFVPISALDGDNVVNKSERTPWYEGPTLLYLLENIQVVDDHDFVDARFPVQYVVRPMRKDLPDYRGYAGKVAGGVFKKGDEVMILPSGMQSKVLAVDFFDGELAEAFPPMSCTLLLEDDIDISRGDMIVKPNNQPEQSQDVDVMLCWLGDKPLVPKGKYALRHTTSDARCVVREVLYKVDVNTLHKIEDDRTIGKNDIARVRIRTTKPIMVDPYRKNKVTGSMILIDEGTNNTVGAAMVN
jgi:sulfate adenylyltransferase subunit 1